MKLSRDRNGNKVLVLEDFDLVSGTGRGFSIQTLDNLPRTHRLDKLEKDIDQSVARAEARAYIVRYGSPLQRKKLGV